MTTPTREQLEATRTSLVAESEGLKELVHTTFIRAKEIEAQLGAINYQIANVDPPSVA